MIYTFCIDGEKYFFDGDSLQLYRDTYPEVSEDAIYVSYHPRVLDKLTVYVSDICNGRCVYCYETMGTKIMNKESADSVISYVSKRYSKVKSLSFFGGEPLLNFEIIKYIVEKLEDMISVDSYQIVTNGVLLNDEHSEFFSSRNFEIIISFDGPADIHDKLRINCYHSDVVKAIERIKNSPIKDKLAVNCTYTKYHEDVIGYQNLLSYFEKLGIKYFITNVFTDIEWLKLPDLTIATEKKFIDTTCDNLANGSLNITISTYVSAVINAIVRHEYSNVFCSELHNGLAFDVNGVCYPCTGLIKQHGLETEVVSKCNGKDNPVCNQCWARGLCFYCPTGTILKTKNPPYASEKCEKQELYAYTLEKLVGYFQKEPNKFQKIVNNYYA